MKKYKSLITSSLLVALIIATPVVSFAENNNKDKNDNENKIGQLNRVRENKEKKDVSWFGSSWFNSHNTKDTTTPVISNVLATLSNNTKKAKISWTTDIKANSIVWYSTTSPVDTSVKGITTMNRNSRTFKHSIELKKLQPNTKYYVIVGSANGIGMVKSTEISFTTSAVTPIVTPPVVDTTAPIISKIETTVGGSNVAISWKTDEATASTIFYSTITPVDTTAVGITKVVNNNLTKEHSLNIPNLTSNTLYHFILKSVDASNNAVSSSELSFRTN